MDKIKKVYIDSRYKTSDSISNSDFKFELKEQIEVPDNTVCYIDDISIPHSWYTVEEYNNRLYIAHWNTVNNADDNVVIIIPTGNYTGASFASAVQTALQERFSWMTCVYNTAKGTITISSDNDFRIISDVLAISLQQWSLVWQDKNGQPVILEEGDLRSINDIIRNSEAIPAADASPTFETEFLDLLNVHNIYIHCPNIGHYNCIGVRGESSIIKKVPVSSSFGYLIMDSVVAPHDKIDVSKQSIKTMHFTLKNVHGNIINLHGSHVSFSLIFQTIE